MKHTPFLLIPVLAALTLTSCVVPGPYSDPGVASVGVSYSSYESLPPNYVGDSYYYGGRYYSGGRLESGTFHDHGHAYTSRYHHDGQYYYGGRHEYHGGPGNGYHNGDHEGPRGQPVYRQSSWQPDSSPQRYDSQRIRIQ